MLYKLYKYIFLFIQIFSYFYIIKISKIKIGVIGLSHNTNIGNNLLKYAISTKLIEMGFIPYIIGLFDNKSNYDISFIKNYTNLIIIKNFSEIKPNDYDILMVNSDQTWRKFLKSESNFPNVAFLYFAKNWNIFKFIYGASLGFSKWKFNRTDEEIAKTSLKNFNDISVREKGAIIHIQKHFNIKPELVLDPTLLIDKKYYLHLKSDYIDINFINKNFIFIYLLSEEQNILRFIKQTVEKLKYKLFQVKENDNNSVKKFLFGVYNCKAVITDSYHATIFSIIFKKPFVSFLHKNGANDRFISLEEIFHIENRIFEYNKIPDINLLRTPLKINQNEMNSLKMKSINYLKKNLKHFSFLNIKKIFF